MRGRQRCRCRPDAGGHAVVVPAVGLGLLSAFVTYLAMRRGRANATAMPHDIGLPVVMHITVRTVVHSMTRRLKRRIALVSYAALVACVNHAPQTAGAPPVADLTQPPDWMRGIWTRDWIQRGAARTSTFDVHYLQTPSLFGDVRIPMARPSFANANSFADLTDEQLRALARQRGFMGRTTVAGLISTWHHEIDFQPPDGSDDIGRLERHGSDAMYEHAPDSSYIESWQRTSSGDARFLAIRVTQAGRTRRALLVAGDEFMYVRNRGSDLPTAESLDSLIAVTRADRARIVAYLDCEFSYGRVRSGAVPWEIRRSTLPWREGRHLDFVDSITVADGATTPSLRVPSTGEWTVPVNTLSRAELVRLFTGAPAK